MTKAIEANLERALGAILNGDKALRDALIKSPRRFI